MRSILSYISNTGFRLTERWVRKQFSILNKKFFDGRLHTPIIEIVKKSNSFWLNTFAITTFQRDRENSTIYDIELKMMAFQDKLSEQDWSEILIHEMVHIEDYELHKEYYSIPSWERGDKFNDSAESHSGFFQKRAEELNRYGWHIGQYAPDFIVNKCK